MTMLGRVTTDKENVIPNGSSALKGKSKQWKDSTIDLNGNVQITSLKKSREDLLDQVLKKTCPKRSYEEFFRYDYSRLVHLTPEASTKEHIALLEKDTGSLENASYLKLKIWLAFADFVEHHNRAQCARLVYEKMWDLRIARYYKEFYHSWVGFEIRCHDMEGAKAVFERAVENKVVEVSSSSPKPEEKDLDVMFESWVKQHEKLGHGSLMTRSHGSTLEDEEETIALTDNVTRKGTGMEKRRSEGDNGEDEEDDGDNAPTIAMMEGSKRKEKQQQNEPTITFHKTTTSNNPRTAKKKVLKVGQMKKTTTTTTNLSRIGRAQRVVRVDSNNTDNESKENETNNNNINTNQIIEEGEEEVDDDETMEKTEKLTKRLGDVSYIKNWTPRKSSASSASSNSDQSNQPTIVFNTGKGSKDQQQQQTITFNQDGQRMSSSGMGTVTMEYQQMPPTMTLHQQQQQYHQGKNDDTFTFNGPMNSQHQRLGRVSSNHGEDLHQFQDSLMNPKNIFIVNGRRYLRLAVIGRGGSSKVFKVLAISEKEPQIYALKRIKLARTDQNSLASFVNEISLMERLRGNPNIITLVDSEINLERKMIYMVMEHGEIDLNTMLQQQRKKASQNITGMVGNLPVNFVRLMWMNMLEAVHAIHEEKIVHGDLKPANFLFVKGKLKLIDFGIAKAISNDTTNIMRDTQVGTLNYMSPEAIIDTNGAAGSRPKIGAPGMRLKLGRASDIWSMGCILYQMIYGQTPFHELKLIQKIHCISDPNYKIEFPPLDDPNPDLIDAARQCLQFDPKLRPPIVSTPDCGEQAGLLSHPFLNPHRCDVGSVIELVLRNVSAMNSLRFSSDQKWYHHVIRLIEVGDHEQAESVLKRATASAAPKPTTEISSNKDRPPMKKSSSFGAKPSSSVSVSLQQSILQGKASLQPVSKSSSAKYMREKGSTPEKDKDLASLLREGLLKKREILESQDNTIEAIVRNGDTWDFLGN